MNVKRLIFIISILFIFLLFGCSKKPDSATSNRIINNQSQVTQNPEKEFKKNKKKDNLTKDKDLGKIGEDLMNTESVGFLKRGIYSQNVIKHLGEPEQKTKAVVWAADGLKHQTWGYKSKGIALDFIIEQNKQTVNMITIASPCTLKMNRNIGIGIDKEFVLKTYNNEIDPLENDEESSSLVVGTVYGGVIFDFENNKVSSIFIGQSAE